jgi:hypothetical protein
VVHGYDIDSERGYQLAREAGKKGQAAKKRRQQSMADGTSASPPARVPRRVPVSPPSRVPEQNGTEQNGTEQIGMVSSVHTEASTGKYREGHSPAVQAANRALRFRERPPASEAECQDLDQHLEALPDIDHSGVIARLEKHIKSKRDPSVAGFLASELIPAPTNQRSVNDDACAFGEEVFR